MAGWALRRTGPLTAGSRKQAVVVGDSMGAGAAVWAAAERSELVSGIALIGPFALNSRTNPIMQLVFRLAISGSWARRTWLSYLPKLDPRPRQPGSGQLLAKAGTDGQSSGDLA